MCVVYSKYSTNDLFPDIYLLITVKHIFTNSHAQHPKSFYLEAEQNKYKSTYFKLRTKASELFIYWTWNRLCRVQNRSLYSSQFNTPCFECLPHMSNCEKDTFFSNTRKMFHLCIFKLWVRIDAFYFTEVKRCAC